MKTGNFFKVDESSRPDQAIVYYRYLPVHTIKSKGAESDYPIYLTITSSEITFYLQQRGENRIYNHSELFSIPFSKNLRTKENLKGVVNQLFSKGIDQITIKGEYSVDNKYNTNTYSDEKILNLKSDKSTSENNSNNIIKYKQLILDFLFDLEHNKVFNNSPFYEEMENALAEYPFFIALSAKYDFYYKHKCLVNSLSKGKINNKDVIEKLYTDYYKAKNQWIDLICNVAMQDVISPDNNWFLDIEEEHRCVIFEKKLSINYRKKRISIGKKESVDCDKLDEEGVINKLNTSQKWFIQRYDILSAIKLKLKKISNYIICLFSALFLTCLNCSFGYTKFQLVKGISVFTALFCVLLAICIPIVLRKMFLSIYSKKIETHKSHRYYWVLSILPSLILFAYVISAVYWGNRCIFDPDKSFLILSIITISCSIIIFLVLNSIWCRFSSSSLLLPRTLIAISSAWFAIILATENWMINFDRPIFDALKFALFLSFFILSFMAFQVKKVTKYNFSHKLLWRVLIIFLITLSYSFTIGGVTSSILAKKMLIRSNITREYWESGKYNFLGHEKYNISDEIINDKGDVIYLKYNKHKKHFIRLSEGESKCLYIYDNSFFKFKFYVFPGMLIVNAALAVFVGIFFQLIFDNKSITDSV